MSTLNISLPEGRKAFVDELVQTEGYGTSSEYMRELIRRDQERRQFKAHLLVGMRSGVEGPMDAAFFASLRCTVRKRAWILKTPLTATWSKRPTLRSRAPSPWWAVLDLEQVFRQVAPAAPRSAAGFVVEAGISPFPCLRRQL